MINRRRFVTSSATAALMACPALSTWAQTRIDTLRIIVGFPPGGTTDAFARRVGDKLRGTYANNVIIENKPGAGGQVGVLTLKGAAGDGAHLLYTPASMLTIYPHSYSKLQYSQSDVAPITIGHATDHALVVGPGVPESVKDVKSFVEWAKANPDKASIGNPGAGSMPHLLAGRLAALAGFQITNVPFPGSGPGVPQVLGGQIAGMSSPLGDWIQHVKAGKVRVLATSGPSRSPFVPDVATYKEQGFAELVMREWFGFFLPATASAEVQERTSLALRAALIQPEIQAFMQPLAGHVDPITIAEHVKRMKEDSEMAKRLVTALNFKADS
ncbi:MAG: tripartite tricarboxylate transporter substrate-binding protein [Burkholderiaceae bacterium]